MEGSEEGAQITGKRVGVKLKHYGVHLGLPYCVGPMNLLNEMHIICRKTGPPTQHSGVLYK